ncbi:hypothetical protein NL676_016783 [Syzygium grande]|nr:hypothetical protein NL676_016783 [Syzygium grande]
MRREQNTVVPPDDIVDLTQNETAGIESGESRRLRSLLLRRSQSHRNADISSLPTTLVPAPTLVEYFRNHTLGRNQEEPPPVDDRDSFSSIAAVINSESQVDTAVEIDSMFPQKFDFVCTPEPGDVGKLQSLTERRFRDPVDSHESPVPVVMGCKLATSLTFSWKGLTVADSDVYFLNLPASLGVKVEFWFIG